VGGVHSNEGKGTFAGGAGGAGGAGSAGSAGGAGGSGDADACIGAVTLNLVGSFDTAGNEDSQSNLDALLGAVHALRNVSVRLGVAAVGEVNTVRTGGSSGGSGGGGGGGGGDDSGAASEPRPRCTAAAIDAASGEVRAAAFSSVLARPFALERGSCMWLSEPPVLPLVYDGAAADAMRAPELAGSWALSAADCTYFLSLSNAAFLRKLSTSPEVEGPEFVPFLRAVLGFVRARVLAAEGGGAGGAGRGGGGGSGGGGRGGATTR
jgi:hypothetical protein